MYRIHTYRFRRVILVICLGGLGIGPAEKEAHPTHQAKKDCTIKGSSRSIYKSLGPWMEVALGIQAA